MLAPVYCEEHVSLLILVFAIRLMVEYSVNTNYVMEYSQIHHPCAIVMVLVRIQMFVLVILVILVPNVNILFVMVFHQNLLQFAMVVVKVLHQIHVPTVHLGIQALPVTLSPVLESGRICLLFVLGMEFVQLQILVNAVVATGQNVKLGLALELTIKPHPHALEMEIALQ